MKRKLITFVLSVIAGIGMMTGCGAAPEQIADEDLWAAAETVSEENMGEISEWINENYDTEISENAAKKITKKYSEAEFLAAWREGLSDKISCSMWEDIAYMPTMYSGDVDKYMELYKMVWGDTAPVKEMEQQYNEIKDLTAQLETYEEKYGRDALYYDILDGEFYIRYRLDSTTDEGILGSIADILNESKDEGYDWVASDVDYLFDTPTAGEESYIIHTDTDDLFSEAGAYNLCCIDTGETVDIERSGGFKDKLPLYRAIEVEEGLMEAREKYTQIAVDEHNMILELSSLLSLDGDTSMLAKKVESESLGTTGVQTAEENGSEDAQSQTEPEENTEEPQTQDSAPEDAGESAEDFPEEEKIDTMEIAGTYLGMGADGEMYINIYSSPEDQYVGNVELEMLDGSMSMCSGELYCVENNTYRAETDKGILDIEIYHINDVTLGCEVKLDGSRVDAYALIEHYIS